MATWLAHLRIAENLLKRYNFDEEAFIVGSLAPDSGVPNEDWSQFDPPKEITHWIESINGIPTIKIEDFNKEYIDNADKKEKQRYSFLLGYYFHLISDIEWNIQYKAKREENPALDQRLKEDPSFVWEVKKDWYGLDFKYLKEHKNSIFFNRFMNIDQAVDYLDFFPKGAFQRQMKYIAKFYLENIAKEEEREFVYLSEEEMDYFVTHTTKLIEQIIGEKNLYENKGESKI